MVEEQIRLQDLEDIPYGIALPFREALRACRYFLLYTITYQTYGVRYDPPDNWPVEAYVLIGREDLAKQAGMLRC